MPANKQVLEIKDYSAIKAFATGGLHLQVDDSYIHLLVNYITRQKGFSKHLQPLGVQDIVGKLGKAKK